MGTLRVPSHIELESHETPVLLVRQHWFVFRNPVLLCLFVPFMALSLTFFLGQLGRSGRMFDYIAEGLVYIALACFVLGVVWFFWKLFLWHKTFYLITNLRIILLTRYGLFHHDDRETALHMIQDVKAVVNGVQPSLYGFGDVIVQVSSEDAQLVLERVGKPREVQRVIVREAHLRETRSV